MRIIKFVFLLAAISLGISANAGSKPKIIFLTGSSYSGKSSVREWLMRNSKYGFVWTGTDLAARYISLAGDFKSGAYKNYGKYLDTKVDDSGKIVFPELDIKKDSTIRLIGLFHTLPRIIFYTLIKQGYHNIIVDDACEREWQDYTYLQCVNPEQFDVYVFKLRITEETAKARSADRDGAQIPYYESKIGGWDLEINTDDMTIDEIGQMILNYIDNNDPRAINEEPLSKYYNPALIFIG